MRWKKVSDNIESPKDEAYEHMKSNLFTFLREKIPFERGFFYKIQYYPFVQHYKQQFIKKSIVVNLKYRIKKSWNNRIQTLF